MGQVGEDEQQPFGIALDFKLTLEGHGAKTRCANAVNVSTGYISELSRGIKDGSEQVRRAIAQHFELDYEDFLALGTFIIEHGADQAENFLETLEHRREIVNDMPSVEREFPSESHRYAHSLLMEADEEKVKKIIGILLQG